MKKRIRKRSRRFTGPVLVEAHAMESVLERPPANGEYSGTVKVRVLPPGSMSSEANGNRVLSAAYRRSVKRGIANSVAACKIKRDRNKAGVG